MAPPPFAYRCHWHPQPIRHGLHPEPTGDVQCQSLANHADLV
jgi:hypothetical protein